jgi:hypothetical protein
MLRTFSLLSASIILITGCAQVEVTRITPDHPYKEGVKFYRPHPYLWVTRDTTGKLQGTIIWLPNKNEEYAITVSNGIGSVDLKYKLADGWNLTEFGEVLDSKFPESITALTGSLKELTGLAVAAPKGGLETGLYSLMFDKVTGLVIEIRPVGVRPSTETVP